MVRTHGLDQDRPGSPKRRAVRFVSGVQRYHAIARFAPARDLQDTRVPGFERALHVGQVGVSVVDAGYTGAETAGVIEDHLDDVRLNAKLGQLRRTGSAQV